jgi:DNA phosphorothioation-dependent restriction protein DptG
MDGVNAKMLAQFLSQRMREYGHELNVYRAVVENFKLLCPQINADHFLEFYRKAPAILEITEKQFAGLDELVEQLDEDLQAKALLEFLEKWKPNGEPN